MTTTQFGAHPTGTDAADHTEHDTRGDGLLALIAGRRAGAGRRSFLSSARGRTVLSFDDLWGEVGRWGRWLDHHGAVPGDRIGIVIADPVEFATVSCDRGNGRWAVPVDPTARPDGGLASLARTSRSRHQRPERWSHRVGPLAPPRPAPAGTPPVARTGRRHLTTRRGWRLVVVGHHRHAQLVASMQLLHTARAVARHLRLGPEDLGFNPLPLFHMNAEVVGVLSALGAGSGWSSTTGSTGRLLGTDGQASITWINAVPAIICRLTTGPDERFPGRPVHPLGIGPLAGGDPRAVRGDHRHPRAGDLRDDRGRQPDHRAPAVHAAARRIGGPPRRGGSTDCAPDRAGRRLT